MRCSDECCKWRARYAHDFKCFTCLYEGGDGACYFPFFIREGMGKDVFKWHRPTQEWLTKDDIKSLSVSKSYLYLTLSPDKLLRNMDNTPEMRNALHQWCKNWFEYNPKYYGNYAWCIECGSHGDHLHVHAVVELLNSHKHAEKLKNSWNKTFPKNQLLTTLNLSSKGNKRGEYAYLRFDDPIILQDKLDYFENEKKGSHENLEDLNLRGFRGFITDN